MAKRVWADSGGVRSEEAEAGHWNFHKWVGVVVSAGGASSIGPGGPGAAEDPALVGMGAGGPAASLVALGLLVAGGGSVGAHPGVWRTALLCRSGLGIIEAR